MRILLKLTLISCILITGIGSSIACPQTCEGECRSAEEGTNCCINSKECVCQCNTSREGICEMYHWKEPGTDCSSARIYP